MAKANADEARLRLRRENWIFRVTALVDQISKWSEAEGWKVERHEKTIREELLGTYRVPEISVRLAGGEILLVPVALHIVGGDGRVDLEAIPTLARVKLIGVKGGWEVFADTNVPLRINWNRRNFVTLAQDLLR
jgi:hypothetical protein